jgi:hypothetical protein
MIKVDDIAKIDDRLSALRQSVVTNWHGDPIELSWRKWRDHHSRSQQALYRIWCRHLGKVFGYDEDDVHDLLRYKFLGHEPLEIGGEVVPRLVSTTSLRKPEMCEYMMQVEVWTLDLGIQLPMPEDNEYMKYREAAR